MGKQKGVRCRYKGNVSNEDCERCSLDPLHPCHFTPDMLRLMREDSEPGPSEFSPTRLMSCDRQSALQHGHDWRLDPWDKWPMTRGHMVHSLMEQAVYPYALQVVRERRLSTPIQTAYGLQNLTGKPDLVVVKSIEKGVGKAKVVDYKSTREIKHELVEPHRNHVMQVNMYAWLVNKTLKHVVEDGWSALPIEVDELEIVYVDMARTRRFTSAGPGQDTGKLLDRKNKVYETLYLAPIDMVPPEELEAWIVKRIEKKIRAREKLPPPLEGDAAWVCPRCPIRDVCYQLAGEGR
jgi:hypothetical protein